MTKRDTALSYGQTYAIGAAIVKLRDRALTHLRHNITAEDLFEAFVKDKDKEPIKRVMKICEVNVQHQSMEYRTHLDAEANGTEVNANAVFTVQLRADSKFKFLFPKYMQEGAILGAAPKFATMTKLLVNIHFEWAQVQQVFKHLNSECKTPRQITTLAPWLGTLLLEAGDDNSKADGLKLKSLKDTIDLPLFSLPFRQFALSLERTIAKAQLTPEKCEKQADEVQVSLKSSSTQSKRWDGGRWVMTVAI